jgi:uncharacterized membrane protein YGL010W
MINILKMGNYDDISKLNKFQNLYYNYKIYHNNLINVLTHIIAIPLIVIIIEKLSDHYFTQQFKLPLNPVHIAYAAFGLLYVYFDTFSGIISIIMYSAIAILTKDCDCNILGYANHKVLLALLLASFVIQEIGHQIFEVRKPSVKDETVVFLSAPLLVVIEILSIFGYRKDEITETKKYIEYNIEQYKKSKHD